MKIAIVGAGAMGSIYAGLMADAGNEVWAIDTWADHIEAIKQNGLRVEGASGDRTVKNVQAAAGPKYGRPDDATNSFFRVGGVGGCVVRMAHFCLNNDGAPRSGTRPQQMELLVVERIEAGGIGRAHKTGERLDELRLLFFGPLAPGSSAHGTHAKGFYVHARVQNRIESFRAAIMAQFVAAPHDVQQLLVKAINDGDRICLTGQRF